MKHKHRWQFVEFVDKPENPILLDNGDMGWVDGGVEAKFICECGKIKLVEVKK